MLSMDSVIPYLWQFLLQKYLHEEKLGLFRKSLMRKTKTTMNLITVDNLFVNYQPVSIVINIPLYTFLFLLAPNYFNDSCIYGTQKIYVVTIFLL